MDTTQIALFDLADKRLAWVDRRQQLLAQNIANADTPHFQARDLAPFTAQLAQATLAPVLTSPMHLSGNPAMAAGSTPQVNEHAPDGNAVALDVELSKVADTDATHELVGDIYRKYLGFFRLAIGK
jgi:flagellar basal-body rod protein FlgB